MKASSSGVSKLLWAGAAVAMGAWTAAAEPRASLKPAPPMPAFSLAFMDCSISPGVDFYAFANGQWVKDNPVPTDQTTWDWNSQLEERIACRMRGLLEAAAAGRGPKGMPRRQVGDFYASAMDTNRLERLRFKPIAAELRRIERVRSTDDLFRLLARFHDEGVDGLFHAGVAPDARQPFIYALQLEQGGLALPNRDHYLQASYATQRQAYQQYVGKLFAVLGEPPDAAATHAALVLELETELARASVSPETMHDPRTNYNKFTPAELFQRHAALAWQAYFSERGLAQFPYAIVGQPEFFKAVDQLLVARPLSDWRVYMRWHLLYASARYLCRDIQVPSFEFFGHVLHGQPEMEPRWQRVFWVLEDHLGEAVGQLYVQQYFPPEAKARMNDMMDNIKAVFRERLGQVDWMTEATRTQAVAKLDRLTCKVGYPDAFRDYSPITIQRGDYLGNARRARAFESHRQLARVGQPVDRTEWGMMPTTVNAFATIHNEIIVPAGILQPPFFDLAVDDAVNYAGIGVIIGHELTHLYGAGPGNLYDTEGHWRQWWTEQDLKALEPCFQKLVEEYSAFEALPGLRVDGERTLSENLADLGGVRLAYDALERALARDPSRRKPIDGFTPEQRFFIAYAQGRRTNIRETAVRLEVADNRHAPGRFRAVGPLVNFQEFFDAFNIKPGDPMWRAPEQRAHLW